MTVPTAAVSKSDPPTILRTPAAARYLSLIGTLVIGAGTAAMFGFAIALLFERQWGLAAFIAAMAAFMVALILYVLRDLRGKWGLRVALFAERMELDLPAGRSLIHRPPAQHLVIAYADMATLETRLEAYTTLGMANMQRAYVLACKDGKRLFLFEDRAIGTSLNTDMAGKMAAAIVAHGQVPLRDLGMVRGRGGVLAVWGTSAPDWNAPPMTREEQRRMWLVVSRTVTVAMAIFLLIYIFGFVF